MDLDRVRTLFDAEVRAHPASPGQRIEREGGVVRLAGFFNFISWWNLTPDTVEAAVAEQAAHFRTCGEKVLWRVFDYDQPEGLHTHLARAGFVPEEPATLMFLELATVSSGSAPGDADIRRVRTAAELSDFSKAAARAFGVAETWRREAYADQLTHPDLVLLVAYAAGEAVASARMEVAWGGSFGQLFGGGVDPAHRGLGLYRALVAARVDEARRRGLKYLSTEARESSRPILERLGFVAAARETTWVFNP